MPLANISNSPAASPGYSPAKAAKLDLASVPLHDDEPASPPPPPPPAHVYPSASPATHCEPYRTFQSALAILSAHHQCAAHMPLPQ